VKIYEFDIVDIVRAADVGRTGYEITKARGPITPSCKSGSGSLADPRRSGYWLSLSDDQSCRKDWKLFVASTILPAAGERLSGLLDLVGFCAHKTSALVRPNGIRKCKSHTRTYAYIGKW